MHIVYYYTSESLVLFLNDIVHAVFGKHLYLFEIICVSLLKNTSLPDPVQILQTLYALINLKFPNKSKLTNRNTISIQTSTVLRSLKSAMRYKIVVFFARQNCTFSLTVAGKRFMFRFKRIRIIAGNFNRVYFLI